MVGTENGKLYKTNNTVLTTETAWDEIPTSYDDGTAEPLKNIKFIDKNNFVALGTTKAYTGEVVKSIVEPTEARQKNQRQYRRLNRQQHQQQSQRMNQK